jgi:hypothetical protein
LTLPRFAVRINLPDGLTAYLGNPEYRPGMHAPLAPVFYPLVGVDGPPAIRNTPADAHMLAMAAGWAEPAYRVVPVPAPRRDPVALAMKEQPA